MVGGMDGDVFYVVGKVRSYVMLVDDTIVRKRTWKQKAMPIFFSPLVGDDALNHVGDSAVDDVNVVAKVMSGYLGISPAAGKS